jgi:hypothetical protein
LSNNPTAGEKGALTTVDALLRSGESVFYSVVLDRSGFEDLRSRFLAERDGNAVVVLRGWKCRRVEGFFDEVAAALQFPWYFGENWDALEEVLGDLSWFPAAGYLLMVNDAAPFFTEASPGDLRLLVEILASASSEESPLRVLFGIPPGDTTTLDRLRAAGAQVVPVSA